MAVENYPIVWLDEAIKNKNAIQQYLLKNWSEKEVRQFFRILDTHISLIAKNPRMFQETEERKNVRRSVLTKQTTLYYKFDEQQIEILFFLIPDKTQTN